MVTKEEFKQLKEKYWKKEYSRTTFILTEDFPERVLVITPMGNYYESDYLGRHQIIEFCSGGTYYYGTNGNEIKGSRVRNYITPKNCITIGPKIDEISFFTETSTKLFKNTNQSFISVSINHIFESIFNPNFKEFICDLKRNLIQPNGLYFYTLRCFRSRLLSLEQYPNNAIELVFDLKPKDLRDLVNNYEGDNTYNLVDNIKRLKLIFNTSTKNICKYLHIYNFCSDDVRFLRPSELTESVKIKVKQELKYLLRVASHRESPLLIYRDYKRCRSLLPEERKSEFPSYPQDVCRLYVLHASVIQILNEENIKKIELTNIEKQKEYTDNFYNLAKKFEMSNDTYSIIAYKELKELTLEGTCLHHCVGSYINSVSSGKEYILFLRKNNALNTPFFTIDVTPDRIVRQIHGKYNCNLTDEIKPFIKEWAKKFKLDISNCSGRKCAL